MFAHAVEIARREVDAPGREQIEERPAGEFAGIEAEQRLRIIATLMSRRLA
jgi:hypothetical protein